MQRGRMIAAVGLLLVGMLTGGCVRRVWEAPGLRPGSRYEVSSDMRVETIELDEHEIHVFRMEIESTNRRRYQFVVHRRTTHELDFTLDLMPDDMWELFERRSDGISVSRRSWAEEPSYAVVKAEVLRLLGGS